MARITSLKVRTNVLTRLIARDGNLCVWCSTPQPQLQGTLDHALPYCQDGSNRIENLVVACESCNKRRGQTELMIWAHRCSSRGQKVQWTLVNAAADRVATMIETRRSLQKLLDPRERVYVPLNYSVETSEDLAWASCDLTAAAA